VSTGKAVILLLVGAAIAAGAWHLGRTTEREAMQGSDVAARPAEAAAAPAEAAILDAQPNPEAVRHAPPEAETVYEVPVAAAEEPASAQLDPSPALDWPPPQERPADTPARCVQLTASPSNVSAFGSSGEVVQLVVRAQNGCGTNFDSAYFRAYALAPDGRELASAAGRFPGGVLAGGSAETLIALRTKPALGLTYRAEIQ
jgi:hypothetical protein